jgi:hypothetical protein
MSTITRPRNPVKASSQPLNARLILEIRGVAYVVTRIEPGPDNMKAYRLEKIGGKGEVYDLARTNEGLVTCDCPSYIATHEGTSSCCKHGAAMIEVGLFKPALYVPDDYRPLPEEFDEVKPVAPFDADFYSCQNAVAEGRALWLEHREMFDPASPSDEPAEGPCCPADEPMPCGACVEPAPTVEPQDEPLPPARTLVEFLEFQVDSHRRIGGDKHSWLAGKLALLLEQARFLGATTPEDFEDKFAAAMVADDDSDSYADSDDAWREHDEFSSSW